MGAVNSINKYFERWAHKGEHKHIRTSEAFFTNILNYFSDTLILEIYFKIIKINIFWGDLSGISAKKSSCVPA